MSSPNSGVGTVHVSAPMQRFSVSSTPGSKQPAAKPAAKKPPKPAKKGGKR